MVGKDLIYCLYIVRLFALSGMPTLESSDFYTSQVQTLMNIKVKFLFSLESSKFYK